MTKEQQKPFGDFDDMLENAFHASPKRKLPKKKKKPKFRRDNEDEDSNPFVHRTMPYNKFIIREKDNSLRRKEWESFLRRSEMDAIEGKTTDLITVDPKVKKAFTNKTDANIKEISDFLLLEVSSFQLALPSAIDLTKQSLSIITDLDDIEAKTKVIEDIMKDAVNLKTIDFLASKLGLTKEGIQILYAKYSGTKSPGNNALENLLNTLKPK